jgi:hypothetical protein
MNEEKKALEHRKSLDFEEVTKAMQKLQKYKGRRYGDSWKKHGEAISIFGNTSRKYDRIENIMHDIAQGTGELPAPDSEESVAETVADLAVYCILWLTWIKYARFEEYSSWIKKIQMLPEEPEENGKEPKKQTSRTRK